MGGQDVACAKCFRVFPVFIAVFTRLEVITGNH